MNIMVPCNICQVPIVWMVLCVRSLEGQKDNSVMDPGLKMCRTKWIWVWNCIKSSTETSDTNFSTRYTKPQGGRREAWVINQLLTMCLGFTRTVSKASLAIFTYHLLYALGLVIWSWKGYKQANITLNVTRNSDREVQATTGEQRGHQRKLPGKSNF